MPIVFSKPVPVPVGWDLTNAVYSGKSDNVQAQDGGPRSVAFSTDGTKMFMLGNFTSKVYQYTVPTPFDMTGVTYSGSSMNTQGGGGLSEGMAFSTDGMTLFTYAGSTVYEYTLASAFTLSGASFSGNSFDTSNETTSSQSVTFSPNGLKMFAGAGGASPTMYEYTLASAFDLSDTVTYTGNSHTFSAEDSSPSSVSFSPDGLKMFMAGNSTDTIYQYTVASSFDLSSTVTYTGISLDVSSEETFPSGFAFSADGLTFFVIGATSDSVYQYTL